MPKLQWEHWEGNMSQPEGLENAEMSLKEVKVKAGLLCDP